MAKKTRIRIRPSTSEAVAIFLATPWMQNAFWARVKLQPGCWPWLGFTKNGYGRFAIHGTQVYAHRLSYAYWHGVDPGELNVCHDCDNPPCTNPEHHFLGTHADNNADRVAKQRSGSTKGKTFIRGEQTGGAKLREEKVRTIIELHAAGAKQADLALMFGVKPNTISTIVNKKTWKHLEEGATAPIAPPVAPRGSHHTPSKFKSGSATRRRPTSEEGHT